MSDKYFEILSTYIGTITWFIILIAAKISHISTRKKLTREQLVSNILYALIGGVIGYWLTFAYQKNIRVIAIAIGVLGGDVIVAWIPDNLKGFLDTMGDIFKKWLTRKK